MEQVGKSPYVRMYTLTVGNIRTAGRDGQGGGPRWLTSIMTPFNSAGAEEKGMNSYADTCSRLLSFLRMNPACIQAWMQTPISQ